MSEPFGVTPSTSAGWRERLAAWILGRPLDDPTKEAPAPSRGCQHDGILINRGDDVFCRECGKRVEI